MTLDTSYLSSTAQQLWSTWNVRVFILVSLLLQCLLVLCASEKKRTNKGWLVTLISLAYYLADWVAPFTIGLISNRHYGCVSAAGVINGYLLAFWAPFLLLHLGGPDNVTSLSAVENDQWRTNSSRLSAQIVSAIIIIFQSLPNKPFHWASLMVFVAGAIKVVERILSLRFASSNSWKYSNATLIMQHDYEKLIETQLATRKANLPTQVESVKLIPKKLKHCKQTRRDEQLEFNIISDQLDGKSLLQFACFFYNNFKGLFTRDVNYGDNQRQFSREFFLRRSSDDAFRLVEIELSFLHEDRHTKVATRNLVIRFVTLALLATASHSFYDYHKKEFSKIDIGISYTLLSGAFVLEIVYLLMALFSGRNCWSLFKPFANSIVNMRMWPLHEGMKLEIEFTSGTVSKSLKDNIFEELCTRSKLADKVETAKLICSQRGDWALMRRSSYHQLKWSLGEVEYGHSLLLWHIATDLLLYNINDSENHASYREHQFCKKISEYMLYLLLMKPTMIAPIAGNWVKIFWDTSLEAKRLFNKRSITDHKQACDAILSVDTKFKPVILKGDESASVLFDACRLEKQLLEFKEDNRWGLMSGVWMELLSYAAFHCEGTVHAQNPSEGGELLTFVWLLSNQLGLGKRFHEEPVRTRYKVDVKK
ncbi:hypothetical protein RHGRI_020411 [Rhododendron griersonianum]|uniref:DUF4220 domain-containing protein n=1 Tax=Rhododendron griersonianum TaxID=479676 RepID=A0AAV6JG36_9ERIC|nr:hypothetical protein RHGRI_020411 [Rhododendron griersonianum]